MNRYTLSSVVLGAYAAVAFFVFAAATVETALLYPNIFRDIPESLESTQEFMSVVAVGDVMRPLGAAMLLSGLLACAVSVRFRLARCWSFASLLALISGQFLLSILYLWPRATVLFDDRHRHTANEIERAATEFEIGQIFRITAAALAALFAVLAAITTHRARVLATITPAH